MTLTPYVVVERGTRERRCAVSDAVREVTFSGLRGAATARPVPAEPRAIVPPALGQAAPPSNGGRRLGERARARRRRREPAGPPGRRPPRPRVDAGCAHRAAGHRAAAGAAQRRGRPAV